MRARTDQGRHRRQQDHGRKEQASITTSEVASGSPAPWRARGRSAVRAPPVRGRAREGRHDQRGRRQMHQLPDAARPAHSGRPPPAPRAPSGQCCRQHERADQQPDRRVAEGAEERSAADHRHRERESRPGNTPWPPSMGVLIHAQVASANTARVSRHHRARESCWARSAGHRGSGHTEGGGLPEIQTQWTFRVQRAGEPPRAAHEGTFTDQAGTPSGARELRAQPRGTRTYQPTAPPEHSHGELIPPYPAQSPPAQPQASSATNAHTHPPRWTPGSKSYPHTCDRATARATEPALDAPRKQLHQNELPRGQINHSARPPEHAAYADPK